MAVIASRAKSARWRWAAAIVFSLAANSFVAIVFYWGLRVAPVYDSTPTTIVQLAPHLTVPRDEARRPPRPRLARLAIRPSRGRVATPIPPTVLPIAPPIAPPDGSAVAAASKGLRGVFGCNLPQLTDAERAACTEKWAENRPSTPIPINLDPQGRYASNPEPYLTRMPKNGCKVRAAGATGPAGQQGVAAGVTCGWSF